jgi:hypothetical protein
VPLCRAERSCAAIISLEELCREIVRLTAAKPGAWVHFGVLDYRPLTEAEMIVVAREFNGKRVGDMIYLGRQAVGAPGIFVVYGRRGRPRRLENHV